MQISWDSAALSHVSGSRTAFCCVTLSPLRKNSTSVEWRKLHVAQPSLSKEIRDLEDEIGIRLFERTKRDVQLTPAGRAFVVEAKEALLHSQRAVHAAKAIQEPSSIHARVLARYQPLFTLQTPLSPRPTLEAHIPKRFYV